MDKHKNSARISPLILIFPFLCVIIIYIGYEIWFYVNYHVLPLEPKMSGEFPKTPEWTYHASSQVVSTLISNDLMIFVRTCCSIEAIKASNGNLLWRIDSIAPYRIRTNEIVLAPKVHRDMLIVPEKGSAMAVYSITAGQLLWKTPQIDINLKTPGIAMVEAYEIIDNLLIVARASWTISAYNLLTGNLIWETPFSQKANLKIISDSECLYISENTVLRCYDYTNGNILWEKDYDSFITSIVLENRTIYTAEYPGSTILAALNLDTMQFKWIIKQEDISDNRFNWLAIAGDRLYAAGDRLYSISTKDGSILWSTEQSNGLKSPIIRDKQIFIRNKGKDLFLVETSTGRILGHMGVKDLISELTYDDKSPVFIENLLIVPFGDDRVFSFRLE